MKANKIIRNLVEQSIEQTATMNRLMVQNDERVERIHAQNQRDKANRDRHIADLEQQVRELREVRSINGIYKRRLETAGLDTSYNASDCALEQLRKKLTGE